MTNKIWIDGTAYTFGDLNLTLTKVPTTTQPPITQAPLPTIADYGAFNFDPTAYPLAPPSQPVYKLPSWKYAPPFSGSGTPMLTARVLPTAQAGAIQVGPNRALKTISAAVATLQNGGRIEVDPGTYKEFFVVPPNLGTVTIAGIGLTKPIIDVTGMQTLAFSDQAAIVSQSNIILDNLEITGASTSAGNSACFRPDIGITSTVRNCYFHHSQNGILTNGGNHILLDTEIAFNGWDGQAHNLYFAGAVGALTLARCHIHNAVSEGQNLKSRALNTFVYNSIIHMYATGSRAIDLPDGGNFTGYNLVLLMEGDCNQRELIDYGAESGKNGGTLFQLFNSTLTVGVQDPWYLHNFGNVAGVTMQLKGCQINAFNPATIQGAVTIA